MMLIGTNAATTPAAIRLNVDQHRKFARRITRCCTPL
jgi:hypothetical protein